MRIVAVTIAGLLLATACPAIAETINSPPVDLKPPRAPAKLTPTKLPPTKLGRAPAERATRHVRPERPSKPTRDRARNVSAREHVGAGDDGLKQRLNSWTIGLAAGQPEGAPLRFATELARVLDDGDKMHVVPIVTRGISDNIYDLLYLRGVDAAIVYGDTL